MVTLAPMGTSPHVELLKMGERWQKASEGKVKLNRHRRLSAGGEAAMVDKMRVGGVDAALMTPGRGLQGRSCCQCVVQYPMVFRSLSEVDYMQEALGEELAHRLARKDTVVLFWTDIGWCRYFLRGARHPTLMI